MKKLFLMLIMISVGHLNGQDVIITTAKSTPTPTPTATPAHKGNLLDELAAKSSSTPYNPPQWLVDKTVASPTPSSQELFEMAARQRLKEIKEKGDYRIDPTPTPQPRRQVVRQDCDDTGCPEDRARAAYEKKRLEQRMSRPPGTKWRNFSADDEHGYPNN